MTSFRKLNQALRITLLLGAATATLAIARSGHTHLLAGAYGQAWPASRGSYFNLDSGAIRASSASARHSPCALIIPVVVRNWGTRTVTATVAGNGSVATTCQALATDADNGAIWTEPVGTIGVDYTTLTLGSINVPNNDWGLHFECSVPPFISSTGMRGRVLNVTW